MSSRNVRYGLRLPRLQWSRAYLVEASQMMASFEVWMNSRIVRYGLRCRDSTGHASCSRIVMLSPDLPGVSLNPGNDEQCMQQRILDCVLSQFVIAHRTFFSSSIHRSRNVSHFVRISHTSRYHARIHVTSLGDLGLGYFAGLDSGLDS